ncbi:MAG: sulfite exporter TauE/SafE family protein [Xanthomonadales bacterium]|jgi:uncharacterized membrane protein YfcA|nr:sulfite exporter TauE/SafE family protein [Xanthomonadales bacterium]
MVWEFALIGLVAGFAAGYLGIGGGFVVVPALLWIFGRDPATASTAAQLAVGTSLATMLATSLSSIVAHHRRGAVRWTVVRRLTPGLLAGAAVGAWIADGVSTRALALVIAVFAALAGLQLLFLRGRERERPLPGRTGSTAIGGLIGGISSLIGIGGGSITAPWLMAHGVRAQAAVATAAACGYPIALAGTLGFVILGWDLSETGMGTLGHVHIAAFAGIAVTSVLAAPAGAWAVHKSPPHQVRRAFGVFLLLVALQIASQAL